MPRRLMPERLVDRIIEADARRRRTAGVPLSTYHPSQRVWIEPPFNAVGHFVGGLLNLLPVTWRMRINLWICRQLEHHAPVAVPELDRRILETKQLAERLHRETGAWPALMIWTSHPETMGEFEWLRFELIRNGLILADAVALAAPRLSCREAGPRVPECFLAIDPYALDTIPPWVAGLYAGFMHALYLVWDRQPSTQSAIQRHLLLRHTDYRDIAGRLVRRLRRNVPVLMVLSGGLPPNARLLYTAREFIHRLPLQRWPRHKREAEAAFMDLLFQDVSDPAVTGRLSASLEQAIRAILKDLGVEPARLDGLLAEFREEFRYDVPRRERLFRLLERRVVKKGKPLICMGITHEQNAPWVHLSEPWAMRASVAGITRVRLNGTKTLFAGATDWARAFHAEAFAFTDRDLSA